jgi:hypothetical protein
MSCQQPTDDLFSFLFFFILSFFLRLATAIAAVAPVFPIAVAAELSVMDRGYHAPMC